MKAGSSRSIGSFAFERVGCYDKVYAYPQYFMPVKGRSLPGSVEYDADRYRDWSYTPAYTLVTIKKICEIDPGVMLEGGIDNLLGAYGRLPSHGRRFFCADAVQALRF